MTPEAADSLKGVHLLREHWPAPVLTDSGMPEKEGIEIVREILVIESSTVDFTMRGNDAGEGRVSIEEEHR